MSPLIQDLIAIRKRTMEQCITLQALWFVGCREAYRCFVWECVKWAGGPDFLVPHPSPYQGSVKILGIPLYTHELDRCPLTGPSFLQPPQRGMWMEMSDGNHRQFLFYDGLFYENTEPDLHRAPPKVIYEPKKEFKWPPSW